MKAPEILDKAAQHMRDRAATYDKPEGERSMAQTVNVFNLFHGTSLTEAQGWHLMQILKDVRLFARGDYHADSAEDCTAYCALKAEAMAAQAKTKCVTTPKKDSSWNEWMGGTNPVPGTRVEFLVKSQVKKETCPTPRTGKADHLTWEHRISENDIVRFRVIS